MKRINKMAQWAQAHVAKHDSPSLIPHTHMVAKIWPQKGHSPKPWESYPLLGVLSYFFVSKSMFPLLITTIILNNTMCHTL